MYKYYYTITALLFATNIFAQSKTQITDRHIKTIVYKTIDTRKGNSTKTTLARYDKKGNTVELIEYSEDSVITKWEKSAYTKQGDELWQQVLDKDGKQLSKAVYNYDGFDNVTEELNYDANNTLSEKTTYTYDKFNDKTAEEVYDKDGKLKQRTAYTYESKGMLKSKVIYNADGKIIYSRNYKYEY